VRIDFVNRQRIVAIDRNRIERIAAATIVALGKIEKQQRQNASITIVFVRDSKIRELNCDYRSKDYATDVLSFPAKVEGTIEDFVEADYLGDIVISVDAAMRQAKEAQISFEREVEELVIHGILHLCGYDHENDNGEMNRLEIRMRKRVLDALGDQ
jgi:probable rRNA maturation factor